MLVQLLVSSSLVISRPCWHWDTASTQHKKPIILPHHVQSAFPSDVCWWSPPALSEQGMSPVSLLKDTLTVTLHAFTRLSNQTGDSFYIQDIFFTPCPSSFLFQTFFLQTVPWDAEREILPVAPHCRESGQFYKTYFYFAFKGVTCKGNMHFLSMSECLKISLFPSLPLISRSVILAHPKWGTWRYPWVLLIMGTSHQVCTITTMPSSTLTQKSAPFQETFTQSLIVISAAFNFFPLFSVFSRLTGLQSECVYLAVSLSSLSNPTFSNLA